LVILFFDLYVKSTLLRKNIKSGKIKKHLLSDAVANICAHLIACKSFVKKNKKKFKYADT